MKKVDISYLGMNAALLDALAVEKTRKLVGMQKVWWVKRVSTFWTQCYDIKVDQFSFNRECASCSSILTGCLTCKANKRNVDCVECDSSSGFSLSQKGQCLPVLSWFVFFHISSFLFVIFYNFFFFLFWRIFVNVSSIFHLSFIILVIALLICFIRLFSPKILVFSSIL